MTTIPTSPETATVPTTPEAPTGTLLQRVLMPRTGDPRKVRTLYLDEARSAGVRVEDRATGRLPAGDEVSFATYFNAFPAGYWRRWTSLQGITLRLTVSGSGRIDVYRSKSDGSTVHVTGAVLAGTDQQLALDLDLTPFVDGGWYWFDLSADEELTVVEAGWYATAEPLRPGRLAVGICTFNRPSDCVDAMATVAADPVVSAELTAVVVADQGNRKVRDDARFGEVAGLLGDRLHLVEQGNLGGSGGFARAMHETLQATDATHLLFLDDDVQLEADSLHRALTFARYADDPVLVGGQMLALQDRTVLHTMGEVMDRGSFLYRPAAFGVMTHDFAQRGLRDTPRLHRRIDVDYNAWWMCLIPRPVAEELGLPLPLFIKFDDAEYGIRAQAAGYPTVTLPGAAIWHLAWTDKDDVSDWQAYFFARNRLIVAALHSPSTDATGITRSSVRADLRHLLKMEYSAVALHLKAYRDFLAGPSAIFPSLGTALRDVKAEQSKYADSQVVTDRALMPQPEMGAVVVEGLIGAPKGLRGLPRKAGFAVKALLHQTRPAGEPAPRPQVQVAAQDAAWWVLSRLDDVAVGTADGRGVTVRHRDRELARQLAREVYRLNKEIKREFPRLVEEYRAAFADLTSRESWEKAFQG